MENPGNGHGKTTTEVASKYYGIPSTVYQSMLGPANDTFEGTPWPEQSEQVPRGLASRPFVTTQEKPVHLLNES